MPPQTAPPIDFDYCNRTVVIIMQVSILFEVEDLSQASPATVSRAGMVYLNVEDLGWRASVISWLAAMAEATTVKDALRDMVDRCRPFSKGTLM